MGYTELGGVTPIATPDGTVRWYAMLGGHRHAGAANEGYGVWAFVADSPAGPFKPQPHNFELMMSAGCAYDTRFVAREEGWSTDPDTLLINHDSSARGIDALLAPLKIARLDDAGTLRLGYWDGNDALRERPRNPDLLTGTQHTLVVGPNASSSWHVRFLQRNDSSSGDGNGSVFALQRGYFIEGSITAGSMIRGFFVETFGGGGLVIATGAAGQTEYTRCLAGPHPPPPPPLPPPPALPPPCLPRGTNGTAVGTAVEWAWENNLTDLCALPNGSTTAWRGSVCSSDGKLLWAKFTTTQHRDPAKKNLPCAWQCSTGWCEMECGLPATHIPLLPDRLCAEEELAAPARATPEDQVLVLCVWRARMWHVYRTDSTKAPPGHFGCFSEAA